MRHVDVPEKVSGALVKELAKTRKKSAPQRSGRTKYIPVVAVVNGRSARVTLVPAGGGRYRMQINTALRKTARVDAGDLVSVEIRLDRDSRGLPVPADLRAGLKKYPKAKKAFEGLTPAHRRHIIEYFDSAKSLQARQRRLERLLDIMIERALLQPKRRVRAAKAGSGQARS